MKAQPVRLLDVFVLGPFMVWASTQLKSEPARVAMLAAGVGTMVYNWENYKAYIEYEDTLTN